VNELDKNRKLQMANVNMGSHLVGECMAKSDFEATHGVVLIAVAREGERINEIPRETVIYAGDTLLFEGAKMNPSDFDGELHFFDQIALPQQGSRTYIGPRRDTPAP
jgi:uncharacterized protein with PhoU and TrkA domain